MASRSRSLWIFTPIVLLLLASFAAVMVVLGIRLDNQDLSPEPPTASEQERQSLAEAASRISKTSRSLSGESEIFSRTADTAQSWVEDLGGVWIAWPDGAPSGYTNAPVSTEAPSGATQADLLAMLSDFDQQARKAGYAQHALSARLLYSDIAELSGKQITCGTVDTLAAGRTAANTEALNAAEAARQWLEYDAAREAPGNRTSLLARIASINTLQSSMLSNGAKIIVPPSCPILSLKQGRRLPPQPCLP